MEKSLLQALKIKEFKWLFSGQVVSDFGNWLSFMAVMIMFTYHWELPAEQLALLPIVIAIPWIFLSPFSGVWADRFSKKKLMIICDLVRSILTFMLIFAQNIWSVLIFIVLIHSVATFFDPARQAAIKEYVPENQLLQANSLSQLSVQISKVLSPTIGGVIVAFWNPVYAFIINSICFLISAILLSRLPNVKKKMTPNIESKETKFLSELLSGLKQIVRSKYLIIAVLCVFSMMFFIYLYDSYIALWSKEIGIPSTSFSLIISGIGLGSVLGAFIVGSFGNRIHPIRMILTIPIMNGILFSIIGLGGINVISLNVVVWFIIWMMIGVIGAGIPIAFATIIQTETPSTMTGKVYGFAQSIINIPILIAPLIGAKLINLLGIGYVFLISGLTFSVMSFVALIIFEFNKRTNKISDNIEMESREFNTPSS